MSVLDIKKYYDEVCNQYMDMLNEIKDFEEECKKGLIEPERLDTIKQTIQPLMNNYQMISYIMFLLNKPVKKSKHKAYENRNKKFLKIINEENTKVGILKENSKIINDLKEVIK